MKPFVDTITPQAGDTLSVDGASQPTAEAFLAHVNDGDSITYSKKGGVQTISLTSNANAGISGSVLSNNDADIDGDN